MSIEQIVFHPSDWVPNNPTLPMLIYRRAIFDATSSDFEAAFSENGWTGIWQNGVFNYQHYHSGAHEVLGVGSGSAKLLIGGPDGKTFDLIAGDALILPAGTGHKNLGSSPDFQIVGAYPEGQNADIQTQAASDAMLKTISSLPVPSTDPICGLAGGLNDYWR